MQDVTLTLNNNGNTKHVVVVNFFKCVVTEVMLFSVVAFKTLTFHKTEGSVAKRLKCGGIHSNSIITNFILILTVRTLVDI